jgi:agmatinase
MVVGTNSEKLSGSIWAGASIKPFAAKAVLFGAPFDGTATFRPGARMGPAAFRQASWSLEDYSFNFKKSLEDHSLGDKGDLELPPGNAKAAIDTVRTAAREIVMDNQVPIMIGGEHSLTLGAVEACQDKYVDLVVIQFDAHADVRYDMQGDKYSHACVMRRVATVVQNFYQFGIRSCSKEEWTLMRTREPWKIEFANPNHFSEKRPHPFELAPGYCIDLAHQLKDQGKQIYITVDLDILDPSIFPGTGSPEPGGVNIWELTHCLEHFKDCEIVGIDFMELNPMVDPTGNSAIVAAKVVRDTILALGIGVDDRSR